MITNQKEEKASISIKRIIGICLIFLILSGVCVFATNTGVKDLKIVLSNNYEMDVITSKTKVSDVLNEKHIILLPDEKVTPGLDETIGDTKVIKISKISEQEEVVEIAKNNTQISMDQILKAYAPITEKIVVEQVAIPFETITKDVSNDSKQTTNKVIQQGKEGIREVTYRIKYQNEKETERTELSSVIVKEPVNKIIQVKTAVTSRSSSGRTTTAYSGEKWSYSASEFDLLCAITAQECSSSYAGSLAVITAACNRAEARGTDPLTEYKRKGQFCYSIDSHWKKRLNGNYASFVSKAVTDALNGTRNHSYKSFRSASTGRRGVLIGGNVYF